MPLEKAIIRNLERNKDIPVLFNPTDYELQKSNQFAEVGIPGLGSSLLQFVKGGTQTLTMDLFFDTTDLRLDVRLFSHEVARLISINKATHAPPRLMFIWGSLIFPCVLESVAQKFDFFNSRGEPLRARLTVTFKEFKQARNLLLEPQLESADRAKHRVVTAGESLQSIAAQEYDDPRQWRPIAAANNIDNPLTISLGQELIVPPLP